MHLARCIYQWRITNKKWGGGEFIDGFMIVRNEYFEILLLACLNSIAYIRILYSECMYQSVSYIKFHLLPEAGAVQWGGKRPPGVSMLLLKLTCLKCSVFYYSKEYLCFCVVVKAYLFTCAERIQEMEVTRAVHMCHTHCPYVSQNVYIKSIL